MRNTWRSATCSGVHPLQTVAIIVVDVEPAGQRVPPEVTNSRRNGSCVTDEHLSRDTATTGCPCATGIHPLLAVTVVVVDVDTAFVGVPPELSNLRVYRGSCGDANWAKELDSSYIVANPDTSVWNVDAKLPL